MPSKPPKPKASPADVIGDSHLIDTGQPMYPNSSGDVLPASKPAAKKTPSAVPTTLDVLTEMRNLLIQIEKNTSGRPG